MLLSPLLSSSSSSFRCHCTFRLSCSSSSVLFSHYVALRACSFSVCIWFFSFLLFLQFSSFGLFSCCCCSCSQFLLSHISISIFFILMLSSSLSFSPIFPLSIFAGNCFFFHLLNWCRCWCENSDSYVNTKLVNINSVTQSKSVQTYSYSIWRMRKIELAWTFKLPKWNAFGGTYMYVALHVLTCMLCLRVSLCQPKTLHKIK